MKKTMRSIWSLLFLTLVFACLCIAGVPRDDYDLDLEDTSYLDFDLRQNSTNNDTCPPGHERVPGRCNLCDPGKYNLNGDGVCLLCPFGANCLGGNEVVSIEDYWIYIANNTVVVPYHCPSGFCIGNNTCSTNREGPLCAYCKEGYHQLNLIGGGCIKCDETNIPIVLALGVALWVLVIVYQVLETMDNSGKTKIAVFFIQMLPLVLGPQFKISLLLQFFNFSVGVGGGTGVCIAPLDYYGQFLVTLIVPWILFLYLPINYAFAWLGVVISQCIPFTQSTILRKIKKILAMHPRPSLYFRTGASLLLFGYSTFAAACFYFFGCEHVGPNTVLSNAPDVSCETDQFRAYRIVAACGLVYVIGGPLTLLVFLVISHKQDKLFRTKRLAYIGVLYDAYKMRAFWWEIVVLWRRACMVFLYEIFFSETETRTYVMFLVVAIIFALHCGFYPYRQRVENAIETFLLFVLLIIAGVMSSEATKLDQKKLVLVVGIVAIFALISILILFLWDIILTIMVKLEPKINRWGYTRLVMWLRERLEEEKVSKPRAMSHWYDFKKARKIDEKIRKAEKNASPGDSRKPSKDPNMVEMDDANWKQENLLQPDGRGSADPEAAPDRDVASHLYGQGQASSPLAMSRPDAPAAAPTSPKEFPKFQGKDTRDRNVRNLMVSIAEEPNPYPQN